MTLGPSILLKIFKTILSSNHMSGTTAINAPYIFTLCCPYMSLYQFNKDLRTQTCLGPRRLALLGLTDNPNPFYGA